jgi:hypothetical protein
MCIGGIRWVPLLGRIFHGGFNSIGIQILRLVWRHTLRLGMPWPFLCDKT